MTTPPSMGEIGHAGELPAEPADGAAAGSIGMTRSTRTGPVARTPDRTTMSLVVLALIAVVLTACSGGSATSSGAGDRPAGSDETAVDEPSDVAGDEGTDADGDTERLPGGIGVDGIVDWPSADPAEIGLDPAVLAEMATDAEAAESHCLLVARNGHIAAESYWGESEPDTAHEVFSVTKSFTALVVGIAADDGLLDPDDPASRFISEWSDTPAAEVTVADLLSNTSGRRWSLAIDYAEMVGAADHTGFAIDLDQADPPGTVWAYNNSAIQTLDRVVEEAGGEPFHEFGTDRLLEPIGMADSAFSTDSADNTLTFMGLRSTCRDLARFGVLVLNGGVWNDERIVSEERLAAATSPSSDITNSYGHLFWLNGEGPVPSATEPLTAEEAGSAPITRLVADAPERLVWALGLGGQVVQMDPLTDTVVVRIGPPSVADPTGAEGGGYGPGQTVRVLEAVTDGSADGDGSEN